MARLTTYEHNVFLDVARKLRITDPQWLIDLVRFESGFDPIIKNPYPKSSARGLIQFVDSTAVDLGYFNSLDLVTKNSTLTKQLKGPVYDYLRPYAPYTSEHQLYMAVFLPIARKYPADAPFKNIYYTEYGVKKGDKKYTEFKQGNPGILSPRDYMRKVQRLPLIRVAVKSTLWISIVAGIYIFWRYVLKRT